MNFRQPLLAYSARSTRVWLLLLALVCAQFAAAAHLPEHALADEATHLQCALCHAADQPADDFIPAAPNATCRIDVLVTDPLAGQISAIVSLPFRARAPPVHA